MTVGLLVLGGLLAAIGIGNEGPERGVVPEAGELAHCYSCPVDGPRLETIQAARVT